MTFSLSGPLPTGTTVIQASAGTGKTYAIVGLAARYVADGVQLSQLMLVTFGRAATQELRDRARERFITSARALADPAPARDSDDEVIRTLATGSDEEVAVRQARLLFERGAHSAHPEARPAVPVDGALPGLLADWAAPAADVVAVQAVPASAAERVWSPPSRCRRSSWCAHRSTAAMRTPLPQGTLASVAPAHRLAELEFELPLAGGEDVVDGATVSAIADLLAAHLAEDDPLAGYPPVLHTVPDATLQGYLTGKIDAVLRYPGPRYVVVDYKTNLLFPGPMDAALFDQAAMAAEMMRWHYPLQALLYSVALHRYLRWRQPGYNPAEHLGGVLYLFLRAMVGESTPPGCGVFAWDPPPALVVAASDLLAAK